MGAAEEELVESVYAGGLGKRAESRLVEPIEAEFFDHDLLPRRVPDHRIETPSSVREHLRKFERPVEHPVVGSKHLGLFGQRGQSFALFLVQGVLGPLNGVGLPPQLCARAGETEGLGDPEVKQLTRAGDAVTDLPLGGRTLGDLVGRAIGSR